MEQPPLAPPKSPNRGAVPAVRRIPPMFALLLLALPLGAVRLTNIALEPAPGAVFNPGMGVYMQMPPRTLPPDHWMNAVADIAYYRLDWAPLNPEPGVYRFDEILKPYFDAWVKGRGKRVAFRVMSQNYCSALEYVSPKWIFEKAGVPGVETTDLVKFTDRQVMPVPWSDAYLDVYCAFVAKLGVYLEGRPGLEFVDIGAIGEWGEMHFMRWDKERREANGFTEYRYIQAHRRIIDAYRRAFPGTRLFLNVGYPQYQTIMDYAYAKGLNFRQDGLGPDGAMGNCEEWLFRPYSRKGVLCNLEFWGYYPQMVERGFSLPATIDRALSAPISYLNANLGTFGSDTPRIVVDELRRASMRVGYRLRPVNVRLPIEIKSYPSRPSSFPILSMWSNAGTAAPSMNLALRWSLHDAAGSNRAQSENFPTLPTTMWYSGMTNAVSEQFAVPAGLLPGRYTLRVSLFRPEDGLAVGLDLKGPSKDARYAVADLRVAAVESDRQGPFLLRRESFEQGMEGWTGACEGLKPSLAEGRGVDGGRALKIAGRKTRGWSYAMCPMISNVKPFALYRLSAQMKVVSLTPPDALPPHIKLDLRDLADKHVENANSAKYSMRRAGEWQTLSLTVTPGEGIGAFVFGWETGDNTKAWELEAYLDVVKLELLEEP